MVSFPFGPADVQSPAAAATVAVTLTNYTTIIKLPATGGCTLNATLDAKMQPGAIVLVEYTATDVGVLTFGTGFTSATVTGVANKTITRALVYDGTSFVATNAQIN